jgi:TATA-box binding protein (TBP) (component of TFIID and TFIIIB)
MEDLDKIRVTNVKISVKIPATELGDVLQRCNHKNLKVKVFPSFIVVYSNFIYTLFKKGRKQQHVNITKCSMDNVGKSVEELGLLIREHHHNLHYTVDNISASGRIPLPKKKCLDSEPYAIDLETFINAATHNPEYVLTLNTESFPGLFIRSKNCTAILFRSGKVNFVGAKNVRDIEDLLRWITKRECFSRSEQVNSTTYQPFEKNSDDKNDV